VLRALKVVVLRVTQLWKQELLSVLKINCIQALPPPSLQLYTDSPHLLNPSHTTLPLPLSHRLSLILPFALLYLFQYPSIHPPSIYFPHAKAILTCCLLHPNWLPFNSHTHTHTYIYIYIYIYTTCPS
jgi:hypothetical protein